jgi:hypothetical protein
MNKKTRSKKEYYKFNSILVLSVISPLFLVGGFNIFIDPYSFYHSKTFSQINKIKPEQDANSRLYKAMDIRRKKPSILLLGSSRVEMGLDVNNILFQKNNSTYNLGLQAVNTYEMLRYFEYALEQQPKLKQVIIGVDFFMFNKYLDNRQDFDESRLKAELPVQDILNTSLSLDALLSSKETLVANLNNKVIQSKTIDKFKFWLRAFLSRPELYRKYSLSQDRFDSLKKIIEICYQKNIDIEIFISPTHATESEAIRVARLWSTYEKWKQELVKITPIWDFSNYNSVTIEPIDNNMNYYIDSSHYNRNTGNLILSRIFFDRQRKIPQDFGILITPANIESHLTKIRSDRQTWAKNHPKEVKLVTNIKTDIDKNSKSNNPFDLKD